MIAAIVLAAGFARRMGRQKLLLSLQGKPVVRWAVERLLPHVEDLVVVTGQDDAPVREALAGLAVRYAVNPNPQ
ncbi:MAG: NTP transferase domain-containing protein, partial [candidate division NC10 bacterium]